MPIQVVAAIIRFGHEYLVCRRAPHKSSPGKWEFPGGKVEPGESPEVALAREIVEELGVAIFIDQHFDSWLTQTPGGLIQLDCFLATAQEMPSLSTDHDVLELATADNLDSYDWAKPDIHAVDKLIGTRLP